MGMNCWEFKKCGREPGGKKTAELGVCPASTCAELNGAHGGQNAGRACWVVAGSLCGGKIQGTYAKKLQNCWRCDFMNGVKKEEEPKQMGFSHTRLGMEKVLEKQRVRVFEPQHMKIPEKQRIPDEPIKKPAMIFQFFHALKK